MNKDFNKYFDKDLGSSRNHIFCLGGGGGLGHPIVTQWGKITGKVEKRAKRERGQKTPENGPRGLWKFLFNEDFDENLYEVSNEVFDEGFDKDIDKDLGPFINHMVCLGVGGGQKTPENGSRDLYGSPLSIIDFDQNFNGYFDKNFDEDFD